MSAEQKRTAGSARPAIVWGASGHAAVVADAARRSGDWQIVGFIDEIKPERRGEAFAGATVLGGTEALAAGEMAGTRHVLLGIGDNRVRLRVAVDVTQRGLELGSVIHPMATLGDDVQVGEGTFVGAGAIVNAGAVLGSAVIINTNAVVEHHCRVGDGSHVAPGAMLAGGVRVGRLAWVGIGAIVIEKLELGDESMLGAGAVMVETLPARVLAYGVPARIRKSVE